MKTNKKKKQNFLYVYSFVMNSVRHTTLIESGGFVQCDQLVNITQHKHVNNKAFSL